MVWAYYYKKFKAGISSSIYYCVFCLAVLGQYFFLLLGLLFIRQAGSIISRHFDLYSMGIFGHFAHYRFIGLATWYLFSMDNNGHGLIVKMNFDCGFARDAFRWRNDFIGKSLVDALIVLFFGFRLIVFDIFALINGFITSNFMLYRRISAAVKALD